MNPNFAPVAVIAALSLFLPLPWHWRARNVATLSIIGWLFLVNIIYAVDSSIWSNSVLIVVPVWCDITTKIIIGANVALPAACLCICIHLENVASLRMARTAAADIRRRRWFECAMCMGLPIVIMALHYIVQGHRYDIIEGHGCRPTTYFSIPAIFIIWLPPILLSIAAMAFGGLALRHFVIRRISFAAHLNASNSALTPSRYLRLMTMSALQMFMAITITCYDLWFTVLNLPFRKWTTWSDVHSNFSRVDVYPDAFTPPLAKRAFYVIWWFIPVSTFVFVAFFSFGKDAMEEYKKCFVWFRTHVLAIKPKSEKMIRLANTKNSRSLTISNPLESKTDLQLDVFESSPPSYSPSGSSFSATEKRRSLFRHTSQALTDATKFDVTFNERQIGKAIGSSSDLSMFSPTTLNSFAFTAVSNAHPTPLSEPPAPLTPPPGNPRRLQELVLVPSTPSSARPLTYPSFDAHQFSVQSPLPFP